MGRKKIGQKWVGKRSSEERSNTKYYNICILLEKERWVESIERGWGWGEIIGGREVGKILDGMRREVIQNIIIFVYFCIFLTWNLGTRVGGSGGKASGRGGFEEIFDKKNGRGWGEK